MHDNNPSTVVTCSKSRTTLLLDTFVPWGTDSIFNIKIIRSAPGKARQQTAVDPRYSWWLRNPARGTSDATTHIAVVLIFPTEVGLLTSLVSFDMSRNDLSGTLPTELGQLTGLNTLDVQQNDDLGGAIPTELSQF